MTRECIVFSMGPVPSTRHENFDPEVATVLRHDTFLISSTTTLSIVYDVSYQFFTLTFELHISDRKVKTGSDASHIN